MTMLQRVKHYLIIFFIVSIAGCALTGGRPPLPDPIPMVETRDRPVNAYYLFSEAHLSLKKGNLDHAIEIMQQALKLDSDSLYLKRELAGFWLMKKDSTAALEIIDEILISHPDDIESLILVGRIHQHLDQPRAAIKAYSRVIALDSSQRNIYLQLGRMYIDREQWDPAKQVYEQLVKNFPGSYAGYFFLGRISAINGDGKTARAYFEKTLVLEPELVESRFELGALYEADKNYKKAASVYSEILKQDPSNIQATIALGNIFHQQGSKKKAQQIFAALGRMSLEDKSVIRIMVRDYLDTRNFEVANTIIQGMLKGAPDSSDLKYLAGLALDGMGKTEASIEQFKQVAPDSRFFQNAAVHAALLYQEMEQIQAAIDFLLETIEKDPQNPEFRLYLGSFYEQVEAYENSVKVLKEGVALDPKNARLYFRLGVVYDKWGEKEDSIAAMRQVLRLDPENANALNYIGYTYADMGSNLDEAEQLIRKALEQKPDDGYITDSLAWVYYKRGQYEKALPLLEQAAELVPDDPIVKEHLGDVYNKLGMMEKALESYRQSIENGHSDKAAVEKKIRLLAP